MTQVHTSGTISNLLKMYNICGRKSAGRAGFLPLLKQPAVETADCARGAKQALLWDELHPKGRAPTPPMPLGLDLFPSQAGDGGPKPGLAPRCYCRGADAI